MKPTRRRLTKTERATLLAMLRERPQASIVAISHDAGVSHNTVWMHRAALERAEGLISVQRDNTPPNLRWECTTCECGADVVGYPARCSMCRAAHVEYVLARRLAA